MDPRAYQHRAVPVAEFRATTDGVPGRFEATVLNYNVLDDYGTVFLPHLFDESMATRMPRVVWAHDWSEPLGRWTKDLGNNERLRLVGEFDDPDYVPRARQALHQLDTGTIDQFSVGFLPLDVVDVELDATVAPERAAKGAGTIKVPGFKRGRLDEVSLVLVGAVPDTGDVKLLRMGRHPGRQRIIVRTERATVVDLDLAAGVLLDLQTGAIDIADALTRIKGAATVVPDAPAGDGGTTPEADGDAAQGGSPAAPAEGDQGAQDASNADEGTNTPPEPPAPAQGDAEGESDDAEIDAATEQELQDALALLERL